MEKEQGCFGQLYMAGEHFIHEFSRNIFFYPRCYLWSRQRCEKPQHTVVVVDKLVIY